jgi:hypothetical protein
MRAKGTPFLPTSVRVENKTVVARMPQHARSVHSEIRKPAPRLRSAIPSLIFKPRISAYPREFFPQLAFLTMNREATSQLRFFSNHHAESREGFKLNLSSDNGIHWLQRQQQAGCYNFGIELQDKILLKAQDRVVGFRVQRNHNQFVGTDIYYLFDPTNTDHFNRMWESVLAPIQIARQSTVDMYVVNTTHVVWADKITTPHGKLTRLLIGVDFVDHDYALKGKPNTAQAMQYIKNHPEKFRVRSEMGDLVSPIMSPFTAKLK